MFYGRAQSVRPFFSTRSRKKCGACNGNGDGDEEE